MAKLRGPLLSIEAHGGLGTALTFSTKRTGSQVRYQKKQADVSTAARTIQRAFFIEAYEHWNELSAADKLVWWTFNNS